MRHQCDVERLGIELFYGNSGEILGALWCCCGVVRFRNAIYSPQLISYSSKFFIMKAKFGAIVVDGRGKIGGHVASKNRSGSYFRTKSTPVNPQTARQSAVRGVLASFSAAWRALSQAQRNAWNSAVSAFSKTNVFGDSVTPTGKNLYTGLNANLNLIGEAPISAPPAVVAVPEPSIASIDFEDDTVAAAVRIALDSADTSLHYAVYATEQVSPGVGFFKNKYRFLEAFDGNDGNDLDITSSYTARFGTPVAGQKAGFKVVPIVTATGQKGVGVSDSAIATVSA